MENTIKENAQDVFNMLAKGQFIEAMDKYFDNDVQLFEGNNPSKEGKEHCINIEKEILSNVGEFIQYTVSNFAVSGDTSFSEAIMEYKEKDGTHVKVEQAVVSKWKDGKIVQERFYHA
ncbi:MAG: ketosteroid isomerase-like protein [Saprospiraceae bacterium]|jgi:ketosteroid isomerase-like protein